jgi:hypothetical protein
MVNEGTLTKQEKTRKPFMQWHEQQNKPPSLQSTENLVILAR